MNAGDDLEVGKARICLAVTCGLPGAGKTSLCRALSARSGANTLVRHVCFDDYLHTSHAMTDHDFEEDATAFKAGTPLIQLSSYMSMSWRIDFLNAASVAGQQRSSIRFHQELHARNFTR